MKPDFARIILDAWKEKLKRLDRHPTQGEKEIMDHYESFLR